MRGATAQLGALAIFASATLFLAGTSTMRRIELTGTQFKDTAASNYVHLSDNNGFGTNAAFIDKGNLPDGMSDNTKGAVLLDQHVQNVAPEGGYINVAAATKTSTFGTDKVFQQKAKVPPAVGASPAAAQKPTYVPLGDHNGFGTNFAFTGKGDGEGSSIKDNAHFESLALKGHKAFGAKAPKPNGFGYKAKLHKGARLIKRPHAAFEKKGKEQMLSQQYLEFGQKARNFYVKHGLMSKAADAWAKKMGTGWEKAPVEMLAQVKGKRHLKENFASRFSGSAVACGDGGPCPAGPDFIRKAGLTSDAERAWSSHFDVEDAADKAPTMMLKQQRVAPAARAVGDDVTKFLFTKSAQAGL